ncbi:DUF6541 family protein [Labedaea rhizosphaerae]|uniref:Dolichyl-phosphate-mannose-protein mannosyltransferase n=1 Tax=Labedaea rhizosphaerae TaxID=598644 RepID=A0A4R6SNL8_LABRH|nr:DUF6541 family protein [Labedaea rhizosphaerae]TDQ05002.1 hypothetical protein EV186_101966 [Labedaea rhizosphaerae]
MIESLQLIAAVLVVLVPGLALLIALGIRDKLWWAALAAPITFGLILITSVLTGLTRIPFTAYAVLVVTALAVGIGFTIRRLSVKPPAYDPPPKATATVRLAQVVGALLMLAGIVTAYVTWRTSMGAWATPTQEHDPITHSVLTAYIHFTGRAAPWQLAPANVLTGQPVAFYPPGFPQLSAVITDVTGGHPLVGMNLATIVVLAIVWPLTAGALAAAVVRLTDRGPGWTYVAAGLAGLIAAVIYKPTISLPHDGGVYPQAVASVLVPGLIAAMLTVRRRHWAGGVLIGIALAGTISAHSSTIVPIGVTVAGAAIGLLVTRAGRARFAEVVLPLLVTLGFAVILLLPVISGSASQGGSVSDHPPDIEVQTLRQALDNTFDLTYGGFFDPTGALRQLTLGMITILGALAVIVLRRGWPILTAYLAWVGVVMLFQLAPTNVISRTLGAFYYQGFLRLEVNMFLLIPAVIGVGGAMVAAALAGLAKFWRFAPIATLAAVVVATAVLFSTTLSGYADRNTEALTSRYTKPDINRYDMSDFVAVDWLHQHVKPGEVIMNNANDGSTLAYVEFGLPLVNTSSMGQQFLVPQTVTLLSRFNQYPTDGEIQRILRDYNVTWVYVDSWAPIILADQRSWVGAEYYTLAPGLNDIAGLPGMSVAFKSGHVTIYRLDLSAMPATSPQPAGHPPR